MTDKLKHVSFDKNGVKVEEITNILTSVQKQSGAKRSSNQYELRQIFRQFEDLRDLENAIAVAQNVYKPNRQELHRIYDEVEMDAHFTSQWEVRKMKTLEREFIITDENDEVVESAQDFFNQSWFIDFMHLALDSKKRGFTAIEFGPVKNNQFGSYRDRHGMLHEPIEAIPHRHISAERGELLRNDSDFSGLDILSGPLSKNILFIGSSKDFGLLYKIARGVLIKHNALLNWSEWAELFGQDVRIGKTDAEGSERTQFLKSLQTLGSGGFGVFHPDDTVEYKGTARADAYRVYLELQKYIDAATSKLIFGQDVIMEKTGEVRGTAAENIVDMIGEADAKFMKSVVNTLLIPKLKSLGIQGIDNVKFKWENSESLTMMQKADLVDKISRAGHIVSPEYIERVFDIELDEAQVLTPQQIAQRLKTSYSKTGK